VQLRGPADPVTVPCRPAAVSRATCLVAAAALLFTVLLLHALTPPSGYDRRSTGSSLAPALASLPP
jgi:hypothetical protein